VFDLTVVCLDQITLLITIVTFQFASTVFLENACVQTAQCELLDLAVVGLIQIALLIFIET